MVVTRYAHVSEALCWVLGLAPRGPYDPILFGLTDPVRNQAGYRFRVVADWRWEAVREALRRWG